jgi:hypothetical protein
MQEERMCEDWKKTKHFVPPSAHAQFCCVTLIFRQQEIKLTVVSEGGCLYIAPNPHSYESGWCWEGAKSMVIHSGEVRWK